MPTRRALIVGINHYQNFGDLRCAVDDAKAIAEILSKNEDETPNYTTKLIVSGPGQPIVSRAALREKWIELFENFDGDILFYFSGHGADTPWGGCLVTEDGTEQELGVSMEDLLLLSNRSRSKDVVLILDCCHSGDVGNPPILQGLPSSLSLLREGVTVLAASRANEVAYEVNGHGMFTEAILEGLAGGAADHLGNVNPASLYLFVERLFDAWAQRPIYKSHTGTVSTLRCCIPPVSRDVLRLLTEYFPMPESSIQLDPEYETEPTAVTTPERALKVRNSRHFKTLRDARLLESVSGEDFYWVAMNSGEIRLTRLGKYYRRLVSQGQI